MRAEYRYLLLSLSNMDFVKYRCNIQFRELPYL